jgi:uncharacterized protein YbjT (DUF2867 family)
LRSGGPSRSRAGVIHRQGPDPLASDHSPPTSADSPILVTGATGYIGGRLVRRLLDAGYRVRCFAREPRKLSARDWIDHPRVEIIQGDAADPDSLESALTGCVTAYYLIHSMESAGKAYRERDRALAAGFAEAAEEAGVGRMIYLGGLGRPDRG